MQTVPFLSNSVHLEMQVDLCEPFIKNIVSICRGCSRAPVLKTQQRNNNNKATRKILEWNTHTVTNYPFLDNLSQMNFCSHFSIWRFYAEEQTTFPWSKQDGFQTSSTVQLFLHYFQKLQEYSDWSHLQITKANGWDGARCTSSLCFKLEFEVIMEHRSPICIASAHPDTLT